MPITARGQGLNTPQFWGSLLFMHTPFDAEQQKFKVINTHGREFVFRGSATTHPKEQSPSVPHIVGVLLYLC